MIKYLAIIALIFISCNSKTNIEEQASLYLSRSKTDLKNNNFDKAKDEIVKMRQTYPKAFNARENAIILMDSINYCEAKFELRRCDSLLKLKPKSVSKKYTLKEQYDDANQKMKFFFRKINYDKLHKVVHKKK